MGSPSQFSAPGNPVLGGSSCSMEGSSSASIALCRDTPCGFSSVTPREKSSSKIPVHLSFGSGCSFKRVSTSAMATRQIRTRLTDLTWMCSVCQWGRSRSDA